MMSISKVSKGIVYEIIKAFEQLTAVILRKCFVFRIQQPYVRSNTCLNQSMDQSI